MFLVMMVVGVDAFGWHSVVSDDDYESFFFSDNDSLLTRMFW